MLDLCPKLALNKISHGWFPTSKPLGWLGEFRKPGLAFNAFFCSAFMHYMKQKHALKPNVATWI